MANWFMLACAEEERPLQDSHLMPARIYAIVRDGDHRADHRCS